MIYYADLSGPKRTTNHAIALTEDALALADEISDLTAMLQVVLGRLRNGRTNEVSFARLRKEARREK